MRTVAANIRQAVFSRGFLWAAAGTALVLLLSSVEMFLGAFRVTAAASGGGLLPPGYHADMLLSALSGDAMTLALPILAALPYTAAIVDDIKSGFIKSYLPRTTTVNYLAGKVTACALSGGLALLLGIAFAWGVCALTLMPREAAPAVITAATEGAEAAARQISPLWGKMPLFFLSGCLWSVTGMLFATLTQSRYMAYASPFVIYYVLIILYERYFDKLYVLYPKEWLSPSPLWDYGNAGVAALLIELTVILAICACIAGKRRLQRL